MKKLLSALGVLLIALAAVLGGAGAGSASAATTYGTGMGVAVGPDPENMIACTLGPIGTGRDGRSRAFIAGHCGRAGSVVYVRDGEQIGERIGTVVERASGTDAALVQFDPHVRVTSMVASPDGTVVPLLGALSAAEVAESRPILCRNGATTGYHCAELQGIVGGDVIAPMSGTGQGDSGSGLFVFGDDGAYAVAVTQSMSEYIPVADLAREWGVVLRTS